MALHPAKPVQGVAILARDHLGLRGPDDGVPVVHKRRAVHVVVHFTGWPPLRVFGVHLMVVPGIKGRNAQILSEVGERDGWAQPFQPDCGELESHAT